MAYKLKGPRGRALCGTLHCIQDSEALLVPLISIYSVSLDLRDDDTNAHSLNKNAT